MSANDPKWTCGALIAVAEKQRRFTPASSDCRFEGQAPSTLRSSADVATSRRPARSAQGDDGQATIGVPGIPAAILALKLGVEAVHPLDRLHHACLLQLGDQPIALDVDVRRDVMGHLSGGVA